MSGYRRKRLSAAFLAFGLTCAISASCQSTEAADPDLTSPTSRPTTTTEAPSTTATTRPSTTPTTLSELQQAELDIEAVIQAWWTYPIDSSLGQEGLPLEHTTGLLYDRLVASLSTLEDAGQVYRAIEPGQFQITEKDVDLVNGQAKLEMCAFSGTALENSATGEIIAEATGPEAYESVVTARLDDAGVWKVSDLFPAQADDGPVPCQIE